MTGVSFVANIAAGKLYGTSIGVGIVTASEVVMRAIGAGRTVILTWARHDRDESE